MVIFEKGLLATAATVAGVVFVGLVGYKIIKKKRPDAFKKVKQSISGAGKKMSGILEEAKESFHEGYAQA